MVVRGDDAVSCRQRRACRGLSQIRARARQAAGEVVGEWEAGGAVPDVGTEPGSIPRTRDRARESVLRWHGWRIHRVWSINWWNFEEQEKPAIRDQIAAARVAQKNEAKEQKARVVQSGAGVRFVP